MAASSIDKKAIKAELDADKRNIATLWNEAVRLYTVDTGNDLVSPKFKDTKAMIDFGTSEMNAFHHYRHDGSKVDKLRSLFMKNISYVESGSSMLLNAASTSFPPAAAINTAMTYVLTACKAVSAQYDIVINFFEDLNNFLERVTIIEKRVPRQPAYQNTLMDVFASFLRMCGLAHKLILLGRFSKSQEQN